jgi:uncharacterized protein (DUF169 family)
MRESNKKGKPLQTPRLAEPGRFKGGGKTSFCANLFFLIYQLGMLIFSLMNKTSRQLFHLVLSEELDGAWYSQNH